MVKIIKTVNGYDVNIDKRVYRAVNITEMLFLMKLYL